jgi:pyrroline-5-carboxylate reductase
MKILVIGGGNMGLTYAQSFLRSHIVTSDKMLILEKSPEKAKIIRALDIGTVYGEPGDYISQADLIIMAVKPQDCNSVFTIIKEWVGPQQLVLSIMAGIKMDKIKMALNTNKVVRAMPNLPAQVGLGMTVFTSSDDVTRIELVMVQNLLNSTGKTLFVSEENLIDAATAISGSGPAYVFFFMQTLMDSARALGFSRSEAELLSYQTFKGAVESFNKNNFTCEQWINKVSSKGGTTEAAFSMIDKQEVHGALLQAYGKAYDRAGEISKMD